MSAINPHSNRLRRRSSIPGNFFGKFIRGDDDLFMRFVEGIEGMKKLFLSSFFTGDELDIIEDQNVDVSEFLLKLVHLVASERRDQFVHERLRTEIDDFQGGSLGHGLMPDGVYQMSLAETDPAIDE